MIKVILSYTVRLAWARKAALKGKRKKKMKKKSDRTTKVITIFRHVVSEETTVYIHSADRDVSSSTDPFLNNLISAGPR